MKNSNDYLSLFLSVYAVTAVEVLKPHVSIDPLPKAVLQIFSSHLKGEYSDCQIPRADLSKVDPSLVDSLMPFQREGVK